MKRIRIVGLCLVAVLALAGMTAASAFAGSGQPAWFECAKNKAGTLAKGCAAAGKGFEIKEGVGKGKGFKGKDGKGVLNTVVPGFNGSEVTETDDKVECQSSKDTGKQLNAGGRGFVFDVQVTFSKCKALGKFECKTTGAKKEEIKTNTLAGELGYIEGGGGAVGEALWNEAHPGTGYLAEFTCAGVDEIRVSGSVIGLLGGDVGVFSKTSTSTYTPGPYLGKQVFEPTFGLEYTPLVNLPKFTGEPVDILLTEENESGKGWSPAVPSGQEDLATNKGEELGVFEGV